MRYRLGVSAFVADRRLLDPGHGQGHDWAVLRGLGVEHCELSMLGADESLPSALALLQPASFGVHWPLLAADGLDLQLLASTPAQFAAGLELIRRRLQGTGAAYVLLHFGQRGERWPAQAELAGRLGALADLGRGLGLEIVLEPKQSLAQPDGLVEFAARVPALPAGVSLCLDTNDWHTAVHRHGCPRGRLAGRAAHFHLHAMHLRPDGSGLYLHAPPWCDQGEDPPWPELRQPDAGELGELADPGRVVRVQLELHPRYLGRAAAAVVAARERLGAQGWVEQGGAPSA